MWLFNINIVAFLLLFVGRHNTFALQDVTADLFGTENYGTVAADTIITSVVPGDYDGDSQMDVLLTAQINSKSTNVFIFWGHNQTLGNIEWALRVAVRIVKNFNGDMIPDIFGVTNVPEVCFLTDRAPTCRDALSPTVKLRVPHSNAFIDLNKDFTAEIWSELTGMFTVPGAMRQPFEGGNFTKLEVMPTEPPAAKIVGQSSFVDFDGDGFQDHLLPVCLDEGCQHSAIYVAKSGSKEWVPVLLEFQRKETVWSFVAGNPSQPLALHLGDYNLDGFPDALVVLRNASGSGQQAFLLENVPCNVANCHSVGRMFHIHWDQSDLGAIQNAVMATFFDIYEDVTGQLSQSAHFSLQLPYTVLGLGRSANFLDHLFVGIPRQSGETEIRKQEWTAIIPNSQLIVIPYPHNDPHRWSAKLYLTPSNSVLLTAIALIGVCVFILVIIGILHWQEKVRTHTHTRNDVVNVGLFLV
ncbi:T-cell immunomodulatory protein, partial [Nibea albiflora]